MKYSEFQCPKCGRWAGEDSLIEMGDPEYNERKALDFGVAEPLDWIEKHKCPSCNTEFEFKNSNC
jgi:predicted RNA-binding Zn-ribbon protein involved in translation (DUF1610 family)